mmetsp:Transcript_33875/g.79204  ORF Transcript_33875/g.79204 Transcript_33875/m.79204 type:complete len:670 (+) Transcript_33875:66-2075(+)|eukprot:CAMPEP_0178408168 /NCGR_PEP_ID=MMETSP0689_2-20121128/19801_1 /TAXON_ID=160604 /ORGANISM="Amphidinium massartii, Strain CS-259" /LENGTH=669 /DNA_ID=CAMNT_0020029257 /DNA_START=67 /DNA_END=2076 /DNA_ORIENTATION=+
MPTTPKKGGAMRTAWKGEQETSRKGVRVAKSDINDLVNRAIKKNVGELLSALEIDSLRKGPEKLTLREQVLADKKAAIAAGNGSGKGFSQKYWGDLVAVYSHSAHLAKIVVLPKGAVVGDALLMAMSYNKMVPPNRTPFRLFCEGIADNTLTDGEVVCLLISLLQLKPSVMEQRRSCVAVVEALERNGVRNRFGDYVAAMAPVFQEIALQAWLAVADAGENPQDWLLANRALWLQFLPEAAVQTLIEMEDGTPWSTVSNEMNILMHAGGAFSERLWGWGLAASTAGEVDAAIAAGREKVKLCTNITDKEYRAIVQDTIAAVKQLPGLESLADRRTVPVWYRCHKLDVKIRCVEEHVHCSLAAMLREVAVESHALTPLPCELLLTPLPGGVSKQKVASGLLRGSESARRFLAEKMKVVKELSAESIQSTIETYRKELAALDDWWALSEGFFSHLLSAEAREKLEVAWRSKVFDAKPKTVDDCLEASKAFIASDVFKYSSCASQGSVQSAHDIVDAVAGGNSFMRGGGMSAFLEKTIASCMDFVTEKVSVKKNDGSDASGGGEGGKTKTVRGKEAVLAQFARLKTADASKHTLADLKWVSIFSYVLPPADQTMVRKWATDVYSKSRKRANSVAKAKPGPHSSGSAVEKKKRKVGEDQQSLAMSETKKMLGM